MVEFVVFGVVDCVEYELCGVECGECGGYVCVMV